LEYWISLEGEDRIYKNEEHHLNYLSLLDIIKNMKNNTFPLLAGCSLDNLGSIEEV